MVLDIHARNGGVTHCWWLALLGLVWSKFPMDVIVFASFGVFMCSASTCRFGQDIPSQMVFAFVP